jgi:hypothetical protein
MARLDNSAERACRLVLEPLPAFLHGDAKSVSLQVGPAGPLK